MEECGEAFRNLLRIPEGASVSDSVTCLLSGFGSANDPFALRSAVRVLFENLSSVETKVVRRFRYGWDSEIVEWSEDRVFEWIQSVANNLRFALSEEVDSERAIREALLSFYRQEMILDLGFIEDEAGLFEVGSN
jgi:hypothetical protein